MRGMGVLVILLGVMGGIGIAAYVGGYQMLYVGICQAIVAEGAGKVGPIVRALFFEAGVTAGVLFGAVLAGLGVGIYKGR